MKKFRYFTKPNFTVAETELESHKRCGLGYRPNTSDKAMLNDCLNNYDALPLGPDDVVFDLGANIGGFVWMCKAAGVKDVFAWEPDLFNFDVLEENCGDLDGVRLYHKAMVNDPKEKDVTFVIKDNANGACSGSVNETKNESVVFHKQRVLTSDFHTWLDMIRPNILKIDIEGGEYDLMDRPLPDYVQYVAFELHGMNKKSYLKMLRLYAAMSDEWDLVELDPEVVFNKLQLINVILRRRCPNRNLADYDFRDLDAKNARFLTYEKLDKADLKDLTESQKHKLILEHARELSHL